MIKKTEQDQIQNYLFDASNTKGFCEAVFFPEDEEDVKSIFNESSGKKIPVTISGNRTGLTGAAVPYGGNVISTEKLNKILEVKNDYVLVEPGVILSDLQKYLNDKGLFYPPDPTETSCFIGGTVATNASGARTFKYGATRNFVQSLEIILVNGNKINLERGKVFARENILRLIDETGIKYNFEIPDIGMPAIKNAAGYYFKPGMDAIDLFIGSEGTLGTITKIGLKVLPTPETIISSVVFFKSDDDAFSFVNESRTKSFVSKSAGDHHSINALALEFFDGNALRFLQNHYNKIPVDANAAVWFEQDCSLKFQEKILDEWIQLISTNNGDLNNSWFALTQKEFDEIVSFRHAISEKVNEYIYQHNFRKLGTDVAVPDKVFPSFYNSIKDIVKKQKLEFVAYGHIGNSHIHLNMLPKTDEEFKTGKSLYREICLLALSKGGTFSAEHGVGKNKTQYLLKMYGEENIQKMKNVKKVFDPGMILCRGNLFNYD
jgi:D-lactate dehydrogenase (cytochrome)